MPACCHAGDRPARLLSIHAPDAGFAAFVRRLRDGVEVEWDISGVSADGGLPASNVIVLRGERERMCQRRWRRALRTSSTRFLQEMIEVPPAQRNVEPSLDVGIEQPPPADAWRRGARRGKKPAIAELTSTTPSLAPVELSQQLRARR